MLDFVFILLIFIEIIITYFVVKKALELEKKVDVLNCKLIKLHEIILIANKNIHSTLKKINKVVSFITNKKFIQIKKIISITIEIIQIVIILKSFNYSKGLKFNLKNIKNLALSQLIKTIFNKVLASIDKCFAN